MQPFSSVPPICIRLDAGDIHKNLLSDGYLMKMSAVKVIFFLRRGVNEYSYFQHLLCDLVEILYKISEHNMFCYLYVLCSVKEKL